MGMRPTVLLRWTALILTLQATSALAAASKDQQSCINKLNKDGAKVAQKQGKENFGCIKSAAKGKLLPMQTADQCLVADAKSKISKAQDKTVDDYQKRCLAEPPSFGIPAGSAAETVNQAATEQSLALVADIFGSLLEPAIISCDEDKQGCKCQQAISKDYEKLAATAVKQFVKCKKNALKEGAAPVLSGAMSAADLELCVDDEATSASIAADGKGKIEKKVSKLGSDIAKKCAGIDSRRAAPGLCAGLAGDALRDCIARRVECRVCLMLNDMDDLAVDCDVFDDGDANGSCGGTVVYETLDVASAAQPADTPGTAGVDANDYPKLVTQFGGTGFSLNNATYTRFHDGIPESTPDAVLVLVPGFEGGGNNFKLLAENLIVRSAATHGKVVEVWAYDRRTHQLEDTEGLEIAEAYLDPQIALDWLYGNDLGLTLSPELVAGPNRRAEFHNTSNDVPFIANWTAQVFSRDLDAVIDQALALTDNVFLGGHSAGTGFAARYAATDFDLGGGGPAQPGYAKLKGLVLLEGGGGSLGDPPHPDTLDRIEDKFDGGLFGAVRDGAPRCADGTTPCTIATEATDCVGIGNAKCTEPTSAYAAGLLNPQLLAAGDVIAIQAVTDPNGGQAILQVDQAGPDTSAFDLVPQLATLGLLLPQATALGALGSFIDDDGIIASFAAFVASSVGAAGPSVGGLTTWLDISQPQPAGAVPDNGPAPTTLPATRWGQEKEVVDFSRMLTTFYEGESNFTDWYYPSSGLSVTSVSGVCDVGGSDTCTVGDVGAPCAANGDCSQSIGLDGSALAVGRGRRDIANLVEAGNVDVPVIAFGGSNGLTPVPASFLTYAQTLASCGAASCDGTPRVVDASMPNEAFPTFGGVEGGFEVYITEGVAHVDVLLAEDTADNNVLAPLADFLARNSP